MSIAPVRESEGKVTRPNWLGVKPGTYLRLLELTDPVRREHQLTRSLWADNTHRFPADQEPGARTDPGVGQPQHPLRAHDGRRARHQHSPIRIHVPSIEPNVACLTRHTLTRHPLVE
jgi:hypothetical protein